MHQVKQWNQKHCTLSGGCQKKSKTLAHTIHSSLLTTLMQSSPMQTSICSRMHLAATTVWARPIFPTWSLPKQAVWSSSTVLSLITQPIRTTTRSDSTASLMATDIQSIILQSHTLSQKRPTTTLVCSQKSAEKAVK